MRPMLFLSISLLLTASAAAANDDPPPRKPGLWSVTIEGGAKPMTMQVCTDAETEKKMLAKGKAMMAGMCSKMEGHLSGKTYTQDSVCDLMGAKQTAHSVTTLVDDETRMTVISSKYDPPKPHLSDHETKQSMKWVGPCGADVKPGQAMLNGKVVMVPGL